MRRVASRPTPLKAVIFDLDGTLVDTADEFVVVVQALRAEHGRDAMDPQRIRASVSNGARALVSLALDMPEEAAGFETQRLRLLELYSEVLGSSGRPLPRHQRAAGGAAAARRALGHRHQQTPGLYRATAGTPGHTAAPGSVVCPDDVTERKPHPESLLRNCRELGCAPAEAIYVGDHLRDIEAGKRAGMYTIAAAYGYIEPGDDPYGWGADAHADNSADLHRLILGRLTHAVDGPLCTPTFHYAKSGTRHVYCNRPGGLPPRSQTPAGQDHPRDRRRGRHRPRRRPGLCRPRCHRDPAGTHREQAGTGLRRDRGGGRTETRPGGTGPGHRERGQHHPAGERPGGGVPPPGRPAAQRQHPGRTAPDRERRATPAGSRSCRSTSTPSSC